ncbi:MAG: type I restriction enzyme HsdR N-terminal domain-containing protein [Bacteroidia bacterium]
MDIKGLSFPNLNLPAFEIKTRTLEGQRTEIFDHFRKKYVVLTPEEWVRQHMLHFMVSDFSYPRNLLGVEVALKRGQLNERADIIAYDSSMEPMLIVECKATSVELNQKVFEQAARYNLSLGVSYLGITNGLRLMAARVEHDSGRVLMLKSFPMYKEIIS